MAKAMPKAMAKSISSVLVARVIPTWVKPESMSLTKLMSGTPGTMNKAQAKSGCHGVEDSKKEMPDRVEIKAKSHANSVDTKAAKPMLKYPLEPLELRNIRRRKPNMAAMEA